MVSVRLTEHQEKGIKKTGLNKSEFIRRAVDYYLLHMQDPNNNFILSELQKWVDTMRVTTVLNNNTNVLNNNTDVLICNTNNTPVLNNNTDVIQKSVEKPANSIKTKLANEMPMLNRILNNPLNNETVPQDTLKTLANKYALSKSTINAWIVENKEAIKTGKYEKINN